MALWPLVITAAACSFSPNLPSGKIICRTADCPPGFSCTGGVCTTGVDLDDGGNDGPVDRAADQTNADLDPDGPGAPLGTGGQGGAGMAAGGAGMHVDAGDDLPLEASPPPDWPICTPPPNVVDLKTGLLVYLMLDGGGTDPVIVDSSSNHLSTMVAGLGTGASWRAGRFGGALSLSGGTSGGWIAIGGMMPELALNTVISALSLSVWAKLPPGTPPDGVLLSRRAAGPRGYLYRISVSSGHLRVEMETKASANADVSSNRPLPTDGSWMHLGVSYDGVGSGIELFVNGEPFGKFAYPLAIPPELTALLIGAEENAAAPMPTTTIDGRMMGAIDEVAVYNRALTADQMKALACGARP